MASAVESRPGIRYFWSEVWLAAGLLAMYLPTYLDLGARFWGKDDDSQGPIILLIVLGLLYRERHVFQNYPTAKEQRLGSVIFGLGLLLYIVGRSQEFFQFDVGSQPFVLIGLALLLGGRSALAKIWFPACFIVFLIPIPPSLLDQILLPLKVAVSQVVTEGLYALGYPISRSGVILVIGQYQLLIADACSGLRSMLALSGIGILYVYLLGKDNFLQKGALLAAAIPIAFVANVLRVVALVLVTYYLGDRAGSEFHDIAGYFEIILAFASFFLLDLLLSRIQLSAQVATVMNDVSYFSFMPARRAYPFAFVSLAMIIAACVSLFLAPRTIVETSGSKLENLIPSSFAGWSRVLSDTQQVSLLATDENGNDPMQLAYDDSLLRTYSRKGGENIMLAIAYDRIQREEDRVHRPEICYIAQGFRIVLDRNAVFRLAAGPHGIIEGREMLTVRGNRWEAVSFWIRLGDTFSQNPWRSRAYVITEGLAGKLHDGLLLRTSEIVSNQEEAEASFARQANFMNDLVSSLPPAGALELIANTERSTASRPPS